MAESEVGVVREPLSSEQTRLINANYGAVRPRLRTTLQDRRRAANQVSTLKDFKWWGVVGPQPLPLMGGLIFASHDRSRRLGKPAAVGPLKLEAPEKPLVEWRRGDPRSLDVIEKFESWPIIVEGETCAVARSKAEREASQLLHRVAVLLSLAWDEPWQERTAPQDPAALEPSVPESWPPPPSWDGREPATPRVDNELPTWLGTGWTQLNEDSRLSVAASFWHQGLLAAPAHPSLALVAFTAAIERLTDLLAASGEEIPDRTRCETCRSSSGAPARVKAACALVGDPAVTRALHKLYARRSKTAHGVHLHGTEDAAGNLFSFAYEPADSSSGTRAKLTPDDKNKRQTFALTELQAARFASRALLLRYLQE